MTPITVVAIACHALLGSGALLALIRLARGPSLLDRVVATDTLLVIISASLAVHAALERDATVVPVLVVVSLLAFVGSVSIARHGIGTERLESELAGPVFRLDGDAGDPGAVLAAFAAADRGVAHRLVQPVAAVARRLEQIAEKAVDIGRDPGRLRCQLVSQPVDDLNRHRTASRPPACRPCQARSARSAFAHP